jgi:hypothetical protein
MELLWRPVAASRFYHHWLHGTATNWQNHHVPGSASFTVIGYGGKNVTPSPSTSPTTTTALSPRAATEAA